jgi:tmRNA-binding protein
VVLNPIQSINQSNITLLGTDSFISVISAWCWISKTTVYPFAIITVGALYVSYRHKHLLKSIHKLSTSYSMNNIPFLEIKLYWKSILALQDVLFTL